MKHTPGPWKSGRTDIQSYLANSLPIHYVYRGDQETADSRIMITPYPGEKAGDPTDDALLIAAAPDLLEALKNFVVITEGNGLVKQSALKAIAKAERKEDLR